MKNEIWGIVLYFASILSFAVVFLILTGDTLKAITAASCTVVGYTLVKMALSLLKSKNQKQ